MSTRRVELVQGGNGSRRARRSSKVSSSGNSSGRRGREEEDVPAQTGDGGHRAVLLVAGMSLGPLQVMGLVHDQKVDSRLHGLLREAAARGEKLERDDGLPVDVERVEALSVVFR